MEIVVNTVRNCAASKMFNSLDMTAQAIYLRLLLDADENNIAPRHLLFRFGDRQKYIDQAVEELKSVGMIEIMRDGVHIIIPPDKLR